MTFLVFSSHVSPALFKPALVDLVKVSLRHSHNSNVRGRVSREKRGSFQLKSSTNCDPKRTSAGSKSIHDSVDCQKFES